MRRLAGAAVACLLFGSVASVARADDVASVATNVASVTTNVSAETRGLTRELDRTFEELWASANVAPAPDAAPGELLRRVTLDLVGRVPTLDEARAFLEDRDPARFERVVDRLLASHAFGENVADGLTVVLLGREPRLDTIDKRRFRDWLAARLDEDVPLDAIARDLLTARTDDAVAHPESQYLLLGGDPTSLAGKTARIFLGNRIACAQCHDHPYEKWKRTDFWSLAAYFQRVRREEVKEPVSAEMRKKKQQPRTINWKLHEADQGETQVPLQNGETGRPALALPRFLGGRYDLTLHGTKAPRLPALARAITVENRATFAKAMANRLFALLFGRGVVHPVDDFSEAHQPVHAGLLDRVARGLDEGNFRVKPFLRAVVLTRAYARSSVSAETPGGASEGESDATRVFARMRLKPLSPEQLARSLATATRCEKEQPKLLDRFVRVLGRNDEDDPHQVQEAIPDALVLMNGPEVNGLLAAKAGSLVALVSAETQIEKRVDLLHLAAFARTATEAERRDAVAFFTKAKAPKLATGDYLWSLLQSSEFNYNH